MALLRQCTRLFLTKPVTSLGVHTRSSSTAPTEACGCLWDFRRQTVELSTVKKAMYKQLLDGFQPQARLTKAECARVVGALTESSYVVSNGHGHVEPFRRLVSHHDKRAPSAKAALPLPADFLLDNVEWWRNTFTEQCQTPLMLTPLDDEATIYVDASQWGLGLVVNRDYASFKYTTSSSKDPNWAELLAVEVALLYFVSTGTTGRTITIHTDSRAVEAVFETGFSSNREVQEVFLRIMTIRVSKGLWVKTVRVASEDNLADAPSRGAKPGGSIEGRLSLEKLRLPIHLASFIVKDTTRG